MADQNGFYVPERVLIIVAHADDIEFGMGGTVARWTEAGTQVTYCIVTDNASGSNDPDMTRERLIQTRQQEQIAAEAAAGQPAEDAPRRALTSFCRVLLNTNEFAYLR